jgi:uncharacterized protein (DUF885 family)
MRKPTEIDQLAETWLEQLAAFSPSFATYAGLPGGDAELDDHSPEHQAEVDAARRKTLSKLEALAATDAVDEVTKDALGEQLRLENEMFDAGLYRRDLNVLASPAQDVRAIFDISATGTEGDWQNLLSRLRKVGDSLASYRVSLEAGIAANDTPALRQVTEVITQTEQITAKDGFFRQFVTSPATESLPESLRAELAEAAERATDSYAEFGEFLKSRLAPSASSRDAIGRERYQLFSRSFLGSKVDLDETYEWGQAELARVVAEQEQVAQQIKPGASVAEAIAHLDGDPSRKLHGTDALQRWMQQLSDRAVTELGANHFDIPEPMRKLECMIAPTQHGIIYYTGPSDDFSRPGRMWWSVPAGVTEFDTWREATTVYHEGVPGHHLQIAYGVYNRDQLNSWRRLASGTSGHAEGWALYAERLMEQLGYLDDPADRFGMLDAQRMRAARVVLDIGVHLEKPKLSGTGNWDFDYALNFMMQNVNMAPEFVRFEVNRYFGWPGQAPSYKVGQRVWEQIRDQYAAAKGADFDIREFHRTALGLGGLGLDALARAMAAAARS